MPFENPAIGIERIREGKRLDAPQSQRLILEAEGDELLVEGINRIRVFFLAFGIEEGNIRLDGKPRLIARRKTRIFT